jgi:hypothetical protein
VPRARDLKLEKERLGAEREQLSHKQRQALAVKDRATISGTELTSPLKP